MDRQEPHAPRLALAKCSGEAAHPTGGGQHWQRRHVQPAGLLKPVGVNTQHCLCIVAALPAFHQFQVPVRNSSHVAVDLKKKGFALEQLLRLSADPAGPPTVDCPVVVKLQVRVLWQVAFPPGVRVGVGQLKADPEANSLRFCRPREKVCSVGGRSGSR